MFNIAHFVNGKLSKILQIIIPDQPNYSFYTEFTHSLLCFLRSEVNPFLKFLEPKELYENIVTYLQYNIPWYFDPTLKEFILAAGIFGKGYPESLNNLLPEGNRDVSETQNKDWVFHEAQKIETPDDIDLIGKGLPERYIKAMQTILLDYLETENRIEQPPDCFLYTDFITEGLYRNSWLIYTPHSGSFLLVRTPKFVAHQDTLTQSDIVYWVSFVRTLSQVFGKMGIQKQPLFDILMGILEPVDFGRPEGKPLSSALFL